MSTHDETRPARLRLLVPINANQESRAGLDYAIRRRREGSKVEVIALNVGEIIDQWQVLRFRTQREVAEFQAARAEAFIEEAKEALAGCDIACQGVFRQGDIAFSILDAAEQFACDEIVLPAPHGWHCNLLGEGIAAHVQRMRRAIPVVLVDSDGKPRPGSATAS